MRAACVRCKSQKVKCEKPHAGACARCLRLGEMCVKAPPSRQGKRTRSPAPSCEMLSEFHGEIKVSSLTDRRLISGMLAGWGDENEPSATNLLRGVFSSTTLPQASLITWLLRHFAAVATAKSSLGLFQHSLRLAAACNISFADVVGGIEREIRVERPPQMLIDTARQLASDRGAYLLVMRANPMADGGMCVWANDAFQQDVCTIEQVNAGWRAASHDVGNFWRAFVNEQDSSVMPTAFGQLLLMHHANGQPAPGSLTLTTVQVRITVGKTDEGARAYVPCYAEIHLVTVGGQHYLGILLTPTELRPGSAQSSSSGSAQSGGVAHEAHPCEIEHTNGPLSAAAPQAARLHLPLGEIKQATCAASLRSERLLEKQLEKQARKEQAPTASVLVAMGVPAATATSNATPSAPSTTAPPSPAPANEPGLPKMDLPPSKDLDGIGEIERFVSSVISDGLLAVG